MLLDIYGEIAQLRITKKLILFFFILQKGTPYYPGAAQTLPRGGIYQDRNKNGMYR